MRQIRDNIAATDLLALDVYDTAFKKRQEELARRQHREGAKGKSGGVGKLKLIIESLEEVLEDSEYLATGIEMVRENAARRAQSHAVARREL